jgi:GNAT superfamily N-acetyltransferase
MTTNGSTTTQLIDRADGHVADATAVHTDTRDVFDGLLGPALLATGQTIDIAAATPDDFETVRYFYYRLGDESLYFRYFGIRKNIPEHELRDVVSHEIPHHVTLLARMSGQLIGIGEFIVGTDVTEAELAFAVADDHHHEGVATLLLERLAVIARRCGLSRLTARTMCGNQAMQLVFRNVGLDRRSEMVDGEIKSSFDLASLIELDAQATRRRAVAEHALAQHEA